MQYKFEGNKGFSEKEKPNLFNLEMETERKKKIKESHRV